MTIAAAAATGHEPWHRFDLALAKHYAPAIRSALTAYVGDLTPAVHAYVARARGTATRMPERHELHPVAKASSYEDETARAQAEQTARVALQQLIAGNAGPILAVLQELYGDAYIAGAHAAAEAALNAGMSGAVVASGFGALDARIGWDSWTPGWGEAANELSGGAAGRGLDVLLSQAGIQIRGIEGTTLDRLGALLAEGVASGANGETIAESIAELIDSGWRAELIAVTEVARAMSIATIDTYRTNGITQWDWLITPGACPPCKSEADKNPHALDDAPPPGHPRCRCCAAPVVLVPDDPSGLTTDEVMSALS